MVKQTYQFMGVIGITLAIIIGIQDFGLIGIICSILMAIGGLSFMILSSLDKKEAGK